MFGLLLMVCWFWLAVVGVLVALGVLYLVLCVVFDLLAFFPFQYKVSLLYLHLCFVFCMCTGVCITVEHCC